MRLEYCGFCAAEGVVSRVTYGHWHLWEGNNTKDLDKRQITDELSLDEVLAGRSRDLVNNLAAVLPLLRLEA